MLNFNTIIMYDFETGSRAATRAQPVQIAAVAIEPRTLEIIPNSEFESLIQPIFDKEEQKAKGLDDIEQQALDVNGKTIEQLKTAPSLKTVWQNFIKYADNYNVKGGKWNAPILVGFNNHGFDNIILNRIAKEYGPYDEDYGKCSVFHPQFALDLFPWVWTWFESYPEIGNSLSMDNLRKFFGMSTDGAHDALVDVKDQADIFIRFLKLQRSMCKRVCWNQKQVEEKKKSEGM